MDLGDLDGKMKLLASAASAYLAGLGAVDQEDLDELVVETLSGLASVSVNQGAEIGAEHEKAEALASDINNRGQEAQIAALMAFGLGAKDLDEWFRDVPGPGMEM